jgi:hypothetical protein
MGTTTENSMRIHFEGDIEATFPDGISFILLVRFSNCTA